jgi:hypothetical protein
MVLGEDIACPEQLDMEDYGYESDSDLGDSEDYFDESGSSSDSLDIYTDGGGEGA